LMINMINFILQSDSNIFKLSMIYLCKKLFPRSTIGSQTLPSLKLIQLPLTPSFWEITMTESMEVGIIIIVIKLVLKFKVSLKSMLKITLRLNSTSTVMVKRFYRKLVTR
jgi:hypothetical protein